MKKFLRRPLVILSGLLIFGVIFAMIFSWTVSPRDLYINRVKVTDEKITIEGDFTIPFPKYKSYNIQYKNNVLYVRIKDGFLNRKKGIHLTLENRYSGLKEIYVVGNGEEKKKIW